MQVRFRTNLGLRDAREINDKYGESLDVKQCTYESVSEVSYEAGRALCAKGIAVEVPSQVKAVPAEPVKAVPTEPIKAAIEDGTVAKATADLEGYKEKQTKKKSRSNDD